MIKAIIIGAIITLSMASCKKNRICTCTVTDPVTQELDERKEIIKNVTKKEAEKRCDEFESATVANCKIRSNYY